MLHILWLLTKIILTILGCILGLLLLIILLILFCPIRYRGTLQKETDSFRQIYAGGKVSWLFGLISFKGNYSNGELAKEFYLLGIPIFKLLHYLKRNRKKQDPLLSDSGTDSSFEEQTEDETESEEFFQEIKATGENFFFRLGHKLRAFWENLKKIYYRLKGIPLTVKKFSSTIENGCSKVNWLKNFLEHPRVKVAISETKSCALRLLKHIFPTKTYGYITFGCSDPSVTGTVLAILGMTIPLHRNCIQVVPVFEDRNFIQGNIYLKGRIYGIVLLYPAIRLYFNKNIKYVI